MKHIFHVYHPFVVFFYIMSALILGMFSQNPVCLAISFLAASGYSIYLNGAKKYLKTLRFVFILFVVICIMNPLFNHNGTTILFYLFGNPITLEACLFGVASAGMLSGIFIWFTCYNALMPNDKFLYLFGRIMPTIALMLSMILRLIPVTRYKARCISSASKALGIKAQSKKARIASAVRQSSILLGWTMEDSVDTAESMNARGYGSAKRTSYSDFKWAGHDWIALAVLLMLAGASVYMMLTAFKEFTFFPSIGGELFLLTSIIGYICYAALLCFPLLLEFGEVIRWR